MKKLYKLVAMACMTVPLFTSCEKDLQPYDREECGLKFVYTQDRDSVYNYSFAFGPSTVTVDTVKFEVELMGNLADYDRPIALQQVPTGKNDAVSGVHYVPFDDPSLASKYILPKNTVRTVIPIVLKRDASLKETDYNLKVTFKVNEAFSFTAKERSSRGVLVADQLIEPTNWKSKCQYFFGAYGKVKHQFMIDETGFRWDNDFVDTDVQEWLANDQNVLFGLQSELQNAVDAYNATHEEPLREGPEYGNILVKFLQY